MRALERYLLLQIIDQRWREHLYDMDYLREGIHLRGFAQIDPLVAYKNEAFELFRDLMNTHLVGLRPHDLPRRGGGRGRRTATAPAPVRPAPTSTGGARQITYSGGAGAEQPSALAAAAAAAGVGYAEAEGYEEAVAAGRRAAPRRRERADRAQRPVLVRVGQEVQEVPRRLAPR